MGESSVQTTIRLLREARAGGRGALEDLFSRYLPRVRRIVALRLGYPMRDFAEFEDIVQDSLLRAFDKLDQFQEMSDGTFHNWMATCVATALNLHFRRLRAGKRGGGRLRVLGDIGSDSLARSILRSPAPGPSTVAHVRELEEALEGILLTMKSHQREVIVLRHLCGMSSTEIADAMGFDQPATARKVLSRAMAELRRRLESSGIRTDD